MCHPISSSCQRKLAAFRIPHSLPCMFWTHRIRAFRLDPPHRCCPSGPHRCCPSGYTASMPSKWTHCMDAVLLDPLHRCCPASAVATERVKGHDLCTILPHWYLAHCADTRVLVPASSPKLLSFFFFFDSGPNIGQASLGLIMKLRVILLSLPSAGITGK